MLTRINSGEQEVADTMAEVLNQYPQIDAVMCGNDEMAMEVYQAVQAAKRADILIYGVDGSPEVKQLLAEGTNTMRGTGAHVETFFISRENVEMYGTDGWQ